MQLAFFGILFTLIIFVSAQKSWTNPKFVPEERCLYVVDPGPCKGRYLVWGYDPFARKCEKFYYGGCGGNPNRYQALRTCREACRDRNDQFKHNDGFVDFEDVEGTTNRNGSDYFDSASTTITTTTATTEHEYVEADFEVPTRSTDYYVDDYDDDG